VKSVEVDGDRPIGRDDLEDALPPLLGNRCCKRDDAGIEAGIDLVAELDRNRGVAEWRETDRPLWRSLRTS
jgi:hypothetical protein